MTHAFIQHTGKQTLMMQYMYEVKLLRDVLRDKRVKEISHMHES